MSNSIDIVRLTADDYEELLYVLNTVFGAENGAGFDFRNELPKMCIPDDEHMSKHIAVKKDGKIASVLGVYPIPVRIAGIPLMFSTVGNVATMPEHEGNGYMSMLLKEAMSELKNIGTDASRLCGLRQRYTKYGYERTGGIIDFVLCKFNALRCFPNFKPKFELREVRKEDIRILEQMKAIYDGQLFIAEYVDTESFYLKLTAWRYRPYAALNDKNEVVGYFTISSEKNDIPEIYAKSPEIMKSILFQIVLTMTNELRFKLQPHMSNEIELMTEVCQDWSVTSPSQFKIINWELVTDALLKLKSRYKPIPDGKLSIGIEGYGTITLFSENGNVGCERTSELCGLTVSPLTASRLLFDPICYYHKNNAETAFLPLPLTWNPQDRV